MTGETLHDASRRSVLSKRPPHSPFAAPAWQAARRLTTILPVRCPLVWSLAHSIPPSSPGPATPRAYSRPAERSANPRHAGRRREQNTRGPPWEGRACCAGRGAASTRLWIACGRRAASTPTTSSAAPSGEAKCPFDLRRAASAIYPRVDCRLRIESWAGGKRRVRFRPLRHAHREVPRSPRMRWTNVIIRSNSGLYSGYGQPCPRTAGLSRRK